MTTVKLCTYNILEEGTVTITGTPDTGYPESRVYDRSKRFYWKVTGSDTYEIEVDQGGTILDVDTLVVEGHNFSGLTLTWQWSDNGSSWTTAETWAQSDNNQIVKTLTSALNHRYWKLIVASATNPQCAEVFMSYGYPFSIRFDQPPSGDDVDNVNWVLTYGGFERSDKRGDKRRRRIYNVFHDDSMSEGTLANHRTAVGYLDEYSKPFYIIDHESDCWLAKLLTFGERYMTEGSTERQLEVVEQL
jgi:hypothetical protein